MNNHPVKNGLLAGAAQILITMILYFVHTGFMLTWGSFAGYVILIYFMTKSVSMTKNDQLGFATFGEAFKMSWLTFILGTTMMTLFTMLLMNYIDPTLLDQMKEIQIEALQSMSGFLDIPEEEINKQISHLKASNPFGIEAIGFGLPFSFILPGALFSLIIGLAMKKEKPLTNT